MKFRHFLSLLVLFFCLSACKQLPKKASELVPEQLLGMRKTTVREGETAIEEVKKSHIGKVENAEDIMIINYGPSRHPIVLWITVYPNKKIAQIENEKMAKAMIKYDSGWEKNLTQITVEKRKVYRTSPDAYEEHYFWAEKNWLFYVKIPQIFQGKFIEILKELKR